MFFGTSADYAERIIPADAPRLADHALRRVQGGRRDLAKVYWAEQQVRSVALRPHTVFGPGRDQGMTSLPSVGIEKAVRREAFHIDFGGSLDFQFARTSRSRSSTLLASISTALQRSTWPATASPSPSSWRSSRRSPSSTRSPAAPHRSRLSKAWTRPSWFQRAGGPQPTPLRRRSPRVPLRSPRRAEFSDGEPDTHRGDTHPGGTAIQRLTRDTNSFYFDAGAAPALTIASGETVMVETQDAHCGTITGPDVVYTTLAQVMERNPSAGPTRDRAHRRRHGGSGRSPRDPGPRRGRCTRDRLRLHEHHVHARPVVPSRDDDLSSSGRHGRSPPIVGRCAFRTGRSWGPSAWRRSVSR